MLALAKGLHVLAIVVWIGGVAMETMVVLPALKRLKTAEERQAMFLEVERLFIWPARIAILVAGATGFYMIDALGLWAEFGTGEYWWLLAMSAIWTLFALVVFVLEPLVLHGWFERRMAADPDGTFALIARMHWILLVLSAVTIVGAVAR